MFRTDGYRIKSNDLMYQIVPYIMPTRLDASNNIRIDIELDAIQDYIKESRKAGRPVSHMAILVAAYLRTVSHNPNLNRFCINKKIYARNHFCVSFVTLGLDGSETVNKIYFNYTDTLFEINDKINSAIEETRENSVENAMDRVAKMIVKIPGFLTIGVAFLKFLDRFFTMPFTFVDASPFHTSLFITNLASIRSNAVHHHLYQFGTTSVFIAMGQPEKKVFIDDDIAKEKKVMELCITTDERIADGHYFVKCFKEINSYLKNPKVLEEPATDIVYDKEVKNKKPKWIIK